MSMLRLISEANKEATSIVEAARGEEARILSAAQTYKSMLIASAQADAQKLENLLKEYNKSPESARILRARHHQRAIEKLLGEAEGVFVIHAPAEGARTQLRLAFTRALKKAKEPGPGQE